MGPAWYTRLSLRSTIRCAQVCHDHTTPSSPKGARHHHARIPCGAQPPRVVDPLRIQGVLMAYTRAVCCPGSPCLVRTTTARRGRTRRIVVPSRGAS
jgi:hypothetical protein